MSQHSFKELSLLFEEKFNIRHFPEQPHTSLRCFTIFTNAWGQTNTAGYVPYGK